MHFNDRYRYDKQLPVRSDVEATRRVSKPVDWHRLDILQYNLSSHYHLRFPSLTRSRYASGKSINGNSVISSSTLGGQPSWSEVWKHREHMHD